MSDDLTSQLNSYRQIMDLIQHIRSYPVDPGDQDFQERRIEKLENRSAVLKDHVLDLINTVEVEKCRSFLNLYYIECKDLKEIAHDLECTDRTVFRIKARAHSLVQEGVS